MDMTSFLLGYKSGQKAGGEAAEPVETSVALAMADGPMVITPAEGQTFSKVTVQKPDTLKAENIAKGVDIGGIIGTLTAGGGGTLVGAAGTFTPTATTHTITHDLGVVPLFVMCQPKARLTSPQNGNLFFWLGLSSKAGALIPDDDGRFQRGLRWYVYSSTSYAMWAGSTKPIEEADGGTYEYNMIHAATETAFTVKGMVANIDYRWWALGLLEEASE